MNIFDQIIAEGAKPASERQVYALIRGDYSQMDMVHINEPLNYNLRFFGLEGWSFSQIAYEREWYKYVDMY
jgi:hypothetical protein